MGVIMKELLNYNLEINYKKKIIIINIKELLYNIYINSINKLNNKNTIIINNYTIKNNNDYISINTNINRIANNFNSNSNIDIIFDKDIKKILISNHEFCINSKAAIHLSILPLSDLEMISKDLSNLDTYILSYKDKN